MRFDDEQFSGQGEVDPEADFESVGEGFESQDFDFEMESPSASTVPRTGFPPRSRPPARPVAARILWPALGFPAVIAPRSGASRSPADSDATRTICVLLLSNTPDADQPRCGTLPSLRAVGGPQATHHQGGRSRCRSRQPSSPCGIGWSRPVRKTHTERRWVRRQPAAEERHHGEPVEVRPSLLCSVDRPQVSARDTRVRRGVGAIHRRSVSPLLEQGSAGSDAALTRDELAAGSLCAGTPQHRPAPQDRPFLMNGYKFEYGGLHQPYNQPTA